MPYILNGTTLPNPKAFTREQVETSGTIVTINGATKKDITNRKERFILTYNMLSQANVQTILGIWGGLTTVSFESTEASLMINPTTVHVEIAQRGYTTKGSDYREDLVIVLTEVQ